MKRLHPSERKRQKAARLLTPEQKDIVVGYRRMFKVRYARNDGTTDAAILRWHNQWPEIEIEIEIEIEGRSLRNVALQVACRADYVIDKMKR